jgi:hypothetical protein
MIRLIKLIKKKILYILYEISIIKKILNNQNLLKLNIGQIQSKLNLEKNYLKINDYEFKIFSQFGEDGIIQYLINNINISNKIFVEFGVENYEEANTRFLLENNNWSGLIIDSSLENINHIKKQDYYWRYDLTAVKSFITPNNINDTILNNNFITKNIGLLSVDIDGNDYWVLKAINAVYPDILIVEYNANFGTEKSLTTKYTENFQRKKIGLEKLIYGCSIKSIVELCDKKNYSLVCTNSNGNNAFFVKTKLLNEKIKATTIESSFKVNSFKEFFDTNGVPCPASKKQIIEIQNSDLVEKI